MKYIYKTTNTCSSEIHFDINDDIVTNIEFIGGCPGNTLALSKVLDGQTVEFIVKKLLGNDCRNRGTSCADQLAIAVKDAYENSK